MIALALLGNLHIALIRTAVGVLAFDLIGAFRQSEVTWGRVGHQVERFGDGLHKAVRGSGGGPSARARKATPSKTHKRSNILSGRIAGSQNSSDNTYQ